MNDALSTLIYVPLTALGLLFVDEVSLAWLAQDVAAAAATRGARAALASIGPGGRADADLEERVQTAAAVAMLVDAPSGGGASGGEVGAAAARLARTLDLDLPPLGEALERTEVEVWALQGGRAVRIRGGDHVDGEAVRVDVTWHHPLRRVGAASILDDGEGPGRSLAVGASSRLALDGAS